MGASPRTIGMSLRVEELTPEAGWEADCLVRFLAFGRQNLKRSGYKRSRRMLTRISSVFCSNLNNHNIVVPFI